MFTFQKFRGADIWHRPEDGGHQLDAAVYNPHRGCSICRLLDQQAGNGIATACWLYTPVTPYHAPRPFHSQWLS